MAEVQHRLFFKLILVVLFFLLAGGIIVVIGDTQASMLAKLVWAGVYGVTGLLVLYFFRSVFEVLRQNIGFFALAMLCVVSTAWSSAPSTTLTDSVGLVGSTLLAMLMVAKLEAFFLLRWVAYSCGVVMLLNFFLMLPGLGANLSPAIRFEGMYTHANLLGRISALGALLFLMLGWYRKVPLVISGGFVFLGLILMGASNSMTSIVSFLFAGGVFFVRAFIGKPVGSGVIAVTAWVLLCVGGLLWLNWVPLITFAFELMGRSTTLTGRTELWDVVWEVFFRQPVLGYGYGGFWAGEDVLSARIVAATGWSVPNAHNGFLEIGLDLGIVGVVLYTLVILRVLVSGLKQMFCDSGILASMLLPVIIYLLMLGVTESAYMKHNSIYWVMLVLSAGYLNLERTRAAETEDDSETVSQSARAEQVTTL